MRPPSSWWTLVAAALCGALVGVSCEVAQTEAPRRFRVSFVDSGPNTPTIWRSQDLPDLHEWDGTTDLHYLQLTASELGSAVVTPADGSGAVPGGTIVFLDAPGQAVDVSGVVESDNVFGRLLVPGEYDVLVAPGSLLTGQPAAQFKDVTLNAETPDWIWALPDTVGVVGDVVVLESGRGGQLVVPYPEDFDGLPLGTFGRSLEADEGDEGSFEVQVPPGTYDVVVAPALRVQRGTGILQPDPVAPVHLTGREWPIQPIGLGEEIEIPSLPTTTVIGRVVGAGEVTAVSRVRIEGSLPARVIGTDQYDGGRWIAEMRTDGEGVFRVEVPQGEYTVVATPDFADRNRDVGVSGFDAVGNELIDIEVSLADAPTGAISVVDEDGNPISGASLYIRNTGPPRYAYGEVTRGSDDPFPGFWFGALMRGVYEVEVVPPVDPETGQKLWAREHGVLDLSEGDGSILIRLRPSAIMEGSVFSRDEQGVDDILVVLRDPETGLVVDKTVTNDTTERGFFRAILPESD